MNIKKVINRFTYEDVNFGNIFYKFIKNIFLTFRFVFRNIKYPRFFLIYFINYISIYKWGIIFYFLYKDYIFNLQKFTEKEFLENIKNGKSLIRFGDGEIALMRGINTYFQKGNSELAESLMNIAQQYNISSQYMMTLNNFMLAKSNKYLKENGLLRMWLPMKIMYDLYFSKTQKYGDTEMFYYKGFFKSKVLPIIENKNLIIITHGETIDKIQNNILDNIVIKNDPSKNSKIKSNISIKKSKIHFVTTQKLFAYDKRLETKMQIDSILKNMIEQNISIKDIVLLPACGVLSKILCYEYMKKGLQCLDVGHGMEIAWTDEDYSQKTLRK